ncbi:MAG: hypothetical protein ACREC8_12005 [Limisphaerales bacterium]
MNDYSTVRRLILELASVCGRRAEEVERGVVTMLGTKPERHAAAEPQTEANAFAFSIKHERASRMWP